MTESEWLACTRLETLLNVATCLPAFTQCRAGRRKLRLFSCACCRHVWPQIVDERSRHAVELAEQIADDCRPEGINKATRAADEVVRSMPLQELEPPYTRSSSGALLPDSRGAASAARSAIDISAQFAAIGAAIAGVTGVLNHRNRAAWRQRERELMVLFRDILGNPFRSVTIEPSLLAWRDATIPKLAQAAYDERALPSGHLNAGRLAILADALEEAGCTSEDILAHLRGPGPHVRGCWAVDLLLGKG